MVAIVLVEPGYQVLVNHLARAPVIGVGAPTLAETGIVLTARLWVTGRSLLARLMQESGAETIPCTAAHWPIAVAAFTCYGKGRHPAALNFGDCLTYAIWRLAARPLLCVGDDFPQIDVEVVLWSPSVEGERDARCVSESLQNAARGYRTPALRQSSFPGPAMSPTSSRNLTTLPVANCLVWCQCGFAAAAATASLTSSPTAAYTFGSINLVVAK